MASTARVAETFLSIPGEGPPAGAPAVFVVLACKAHGFRYSPRLHLMGWGPRRGV